MSLWFKKRFFITHPSKDQFLGQAHELTDSLCGGTVFINWKEEDICRLFGCMEPANNNKIKQMISLCIKKHALGDKSHMHELNALPVITMRHHVELLALSRNHRMVEIGSNLWKSSGLISLFKQGYLASCPGPWFLVISKVRDYNLSGQSVLSAQSTLTVKVISHFRRELPVFQFVPIASHPVSGHLLKQAGFTLSLQVFIYINKMSPKAFLLQAKQF